MATHIICLNTNITSTFKVIGSFAKTRLRIRKVKHKKWEQMTTNSKILYLVDV